MPVLLQTPATVGQFFPSEMKRLHKNFGVIFIILFNLWGVLFLLPTALHGWQTSQAQTSNEKKRAFNNGNNFIKLGRYSEALTAYEKAAALDSVWAKAYYGKGLALKNLRRYSEAVQAYQTAIRHDPVFAEAYLALGKLYNDLEQYDQALEVLKKAIVQQPDSYQIHYALGLAYDKKGQTLEAVKAFQRAQQINPKYFLAGYMLGQTLNKLGRYDEALAVVESVVALKENLHLGLTLRAEIYNATDQPAAALQAAQAALQVQAHYAPANFEAGRALKALRRYNEAINYFLAAAKERSWQPTAEYEIEEIKKLQPK